MTGRQKSKWAPSPLSTLEMQKRASQVRRGGHALAVSCVILHTAMYEAERGE